MVSLQLQPAHNFIEGYVHAIPDLSQVERTLAEPHFVCHVGTAGQFDRVPLAIITNLVVMVVVGDA
ncbi:hypothetical protein D3C85_1591120 [compost metagenome]